MRKTWLFSLVTLVGLLPMAFGQGSQLGDDKTLIDRAKRADVSLMDRRLPSGQFSDWLSKTVGEKATITWEVNDCGEATGGPADRGRDMPVCVEAAAKLPDGRKVVLSLAVGSRQRGMNSQFTAFYTTAVLQGEKFTEFRALGDLPALLQAGAK